MSDSRIVDRSDLGLWVGQDHMPGIEPSRRSYLAMVRLVEPGPGDDEWSHTVDVEDARAVVGDVHPWRWWGPTSRGIGSFSTAFASRVERSSESSTDDQGRPITGDTARDAMLLPLRTSRYGTDSRYGESAFRSPKWWPDLPAGFVVVGMAGTEEKSQQNVVAWGDPRIPAVNKNDADSMGAFIIDTEPGGVASEKRAARAQTHFRVAHIPALSVLDPDAREGWAASWQCAFTGQGDQAGLGAYYGQLDGRAPAVTTPGGGPPVPNDGSTQGTSPTSGRRKKAGSGVALAYRDAWGPFHAGHENDQHRFAVNEDGEPVNSGHLDPDRTMWYRRQDRDAPLEFDTLEYGPVQAPLRVRAWIRYDTLSMHGWAGGTQRRGLWRLEAESFFTQKSPPTDSPPTTPGDDVPPPSKPPPPVTEPPRPVEPTDPPRTPTPPIPPPTPDRPLPPSQSTPVPPGTGGGATGELPKEPYPWWPPGVPWPPHRQIMSGAWDRTCVEPEAVAWTPATLGFGSALIFPRHILYRTIPDLGRNAMPPADEIERARATTPAVGRWDSWGAQTAQDWDYTTRPESSRVPGGTSDGGMLWLPPEVDQADVPDSYAPSGVTLSTSYMGWGAGAWAGWGLADRSNGDLQNGGFRAGQTSGAYLDFQKRVSGTWTEVLRLGTDAGNVARVVFRGNGAVEFPNSTTANRPAAASGLLRYNSDLTRFEACVTINGVSTWRPVPVSQGITEDFTADDTLTEDESGKVCHNTSAGGAVILTLPAAANGLVFTFVCGSANNIVVTRAGADTIQINASTSGGAGTATAGAIGRTLRLEAIGTVWYATSQVGAWVLA